MEKIRKGSNNLTIESPIVETKEANEKPDLLKKLSDTEEALFYFILDHMKEGGVTVTDIEEKLGAKYIGAIGKLNSLNLIRFVKKSIEVSWHGATQTKRVKYIEVIESDKVDEKE